MNQIYANFERLLQAHHVYHPDDVRQARASLNPASRFASLGTHRFHRVWETRHQLLAHDSREAALQYQADVYDDIEINHVVDLSTGETLPVAVDILPRVGTAVPSLLG
jgi:hypothetical protein